MRKKISERNIFPSFDAQEECLKIDYLFSTQICVGTYSRFENRHAPRFTLEQLFNDLLFSKWSLRGTFMSIAEMRSELGITSVDLKDTGFSNDTALDFMQFVINCIPPLKAKIKELQTVYIADDGLFGVIITNSTALIQKLGCKLKYDEDTSELFIQYNDELADVIAESHPEMQKSLNEYKRHDNKGNLQRKGEVLCTLYKMLESIESTAKGTEFEKMFSDATFLFNRTGVRHWIEKDKVGSVTFLKMPPIEIEEWYDRTFSTFIACFAASDYLPVKQAIKEIKSLAEERRMENK